MLLYESIRSAGREIWGIYYKVKWLHVITQQSQAQAQNKEEKGYSKYILIIATSKAS